eukprot:1267916-Rhodomonas_salina.1
MACTDCTAFASSPAGSVAESACLCYAGYTPGAGPEEGTCVACPPGTYKPANGSAACLPCAANTFEVCLLLRHPAAASEAVSCGGV